MSEKQNALLLCALHRAGKPLASDDLVDQAAGLALDEGWTAAQLSTLSRKSVARRLMTMEREGRVRKRGSAVDAATRRPTPLFEPTDGFDAAALVPAPPRPEAVTTKAAGDGYDGMSRVQLLTLLDSQDQLLAEFAAQVQATQAFFGRLAATREKVRARLLAAGLGDH